MKEPFLKPQNPQPHILGGNKSIVIKQGNLDAAPSNIQNGRAVFDNPLKPLSLKGNGLIIQKALLRIAQNVNMYPCPLLDLVKKNGAVSGFPDGAGSISLIFLHPVGLHNIRKLSQNPAELIHSLIGKSSHPVGFRSHIDAVADMVNLLHAPCSRNLKNFHGKFIGACINGRKCLY